MKTLIIIRGIPGYGKTTLAKSLGIPFFEADMFFEKNGQYFFVPTALNKAHEWCFLKSISSLYENGRVCVSNTFIKFWELENYLNLLDTMKDLEIIVVSLSMMKNHGSIHNIPKEKIETMKLSYINSNVTYKLIEKGGQEVSRNEPIKKILSQLLGTEYIEDGYEYVGDIITINNSSWEF